MDDIIYVQTVLTKKELEQLLKKVGTKSKKTALRKAVLHYLNCQYDAGEE